MKKNYLYNQSMALFTDLYQLTMIYGYWKAGIADRPAVFHLEFRRNPFKGGFAVAAGLETAIDFFDQLHFSQTDLEFLEQLSLFENRFLDFLSHFSFSCDIDAMSEGTVCFPYEPLVKVKGPLWQAQLLESPLLNLINFQTLIATKAARICLAASPDPVIEFGLRRAQGVDGAISASRAAFIGGAESTSNVIAAKLFGIPVRGTHAHSWIMAFDEEEKAFEAFGAINPKRCMMLIDTYDAIEGAKRAIRAAKSIENFDFAGVRLDSGDLASLSIEIRQLLDEAGFPKAHIMATNELDEYSIGELRNKGAKIDVWGVGTHLVTGKGQSALDGVYKLRALQNERGEWVPKMKLSEEIEKSTDPGILQIRRFFDGTFYAGDVVYDESIGIEDPCFFIDRLDPAREMKKSGSSIDLLIPILRKGKRVAPFPSLLEIQKRVQKELLLLSPPIKELAHPEIYLSGLEKRLYERKKELIGKYRIH